MAEKDWIEVCEHCKRPFSIVEVGGLFGPRDRESIECPHCKAVWGHRKSGGVFVSAQLTPAQAHKHSGRR